MGCDARSRASPPSDSDLWSYRVAARNPWRAPSPRCSSSTSRVASSSGGTTAGTSPQYRPSASSQKEGYPESHSPVAFDGGISYMFIQHNNVFLMTAARQNCNAASILLFLHRVIDVFKHYFEELEAESLRDNFVVVYELLDEMMDFGYRQYIEAKILSEFIKTDAYRMEVVQRPPMAVTNAMSWRSEGIRYKKNEVFLDVVESV